MIFNSITYLIFFTVLFTIYYISKNKYKNLILLIASYIFYGYSNPKNLLILLGITIISYISGILVNNASTIKKKKQVIAISVVLIVGTLLYFKYLLFIIQNINTLFKSNFSISNIIVPLGISFFTLQAITYPIDIYRKNVTLEKNIIRFALFISFFPQILSGPIGKSKEMLPQFQKDHDFNGENVKKGFIIALVRII